MVAQQPEVAPVSKVSLSAALGMATASFRTSCRLVKLPKSASACRAGRSRKALGWAREDAGPTQLKGYWKIRGAR